MNFSLRHMTADDLDAADALRASLGWNQTIQDWRRLLSLSPQECFAAEHEGRVIGTCTSLSYGNTLAWIGMMMVHPDSRRHGIGKALLQLCVDSLRGKKIRCIKLDASPMGQPLYARIGFVAEWTLTRWERRGSPCTAEPPPGPIQPLVERHWPAVSDLDTPVFGADRGHVLKSLAADSRRALAFEDGGALLGFGMLRNGARADYLGPVTALSGDGELLVRHLLAGRLERKLFWDIPDRNEAASTLARALGFTPARPLTRMVLETNGVPSNPLGQWAIADPAAG
jgi:GNAT superfamily N-acetyltransferase